MFEKASKMKLRFKTDKGLVSVEDLWDMPLTKIDTLAKHLSSETKNKEESFIEKPTPKNTELELGFSIVKHVIVERLKWQDIANKAADTKALKQRIMAIMVDKKDDALKGATMEELQKKLDAL